MTPATGRLAQETAATCGLVDFIGRPPVWVWNLYRDDRQPNLRPNSASLVSHQLPNNSETSTEFESEIRRSASERRRTVDATPVLTYVEALRIPYDEIPSRAIDESSRGGTGVSGFL